MELLIGISVGAITAWIIVALFETTWEDIFPRPVTHKVQILSGKE